MRTYLQEKKRQFSKFIADPLSAEVSSLRSLRAMHAAQTFLIYVAVVATVAQNWKWGMGREGGRGREEFELKSQLQTRHLVQ